MNPPDRTYTATGITLKSMPMGESDRLLTLLTKEHGLVRAITPGSRKPKSSLRAISTAFVVADVFIIKGRTLDRLVQADCRASFPGLSRDLGKLTSAQYLAELVLCQALSQHPQEALFTVFIDYLNQLSQQPSSETLPCLVHGIFQFLALAGIAPQVHTCCETQMPLVPNLTDSTWRINFDVAAGGVLLTAQSSIQFPVQSSLTNSASVLNAAESQGRYGTPHNTSHVFPNASPPLLRQKGLCPIPLNAIELTVLQHLAQLTSNPEFKISPSTIQSLSSELQASIRLSCRFSISQLADSQSADSQSADSQSVELLADPLADPWPDNLDDENGQWIDDKVWRSLERLLRRYAQYHFDQPIRSAVLLETCFPETIH